MTTEKQNRIGALPPRYKFILNYRLDARFTRCPACGDKMRQRTAPLLIHVEPHHLNIFVQKCRYCPPCDILLAHWDLLRPAMENHFFASGNFEALGNKFVIIGAAEREAWHAYLKSPMFIDEMMEHIHDFEKVYDVERKSGGWRLVGKTSELRDQVQEIIKARIYTLEHTDQ